MFSVNNIEKAPFLLLSEKIALFLRQKKAGYEVQRTGTDAKKRLGATTPNAKWTDIRFGIAPKPTVYSKWATTEAKK